MAQTRTLHSTDPGPGCPGAPLRIPPHQSQLLLHQPKQPYQLHRQRSIPLLRFGELLIEVLAIGLNPIDWKSAFVAPSPLTVRVG